MLRLVLRLTHVVVVVVPPAAAAASSCTRPRSGRPVKRRPAAAVVAIPPAAAAAVIHSSRREPFWDAHQPRRMVDDAAVAIEHRQARSQPVGGAGSSVGRSRTIYHGGK